MDNSMLEDELNGLSGFSGLLCMQIDVDDVVHVKLEGPLVKPLTKVDPVLYTKYLETVKGKSVMYVQLRKALYRTLYASLLFWKNLSAGPGVGRVRSEHV